jgi:hypothetical protein
MDSTERKINCPDWVSGGNYICIAECPKFRNCLWHKDGEPKINNYSDNVPGKKMDGGKPRSQ